MANDSTLSAHGPQTPKATAVSNRAPLVYPDRMIDPFGARAAFRVGGRSFQLHRLDALERSGLPVARLPYSLKIILENLLRRVAGRVVRAEDVEAVARWDPADRKSTRLNSSHSQIS